MPDINFTHNGNSIKPAAAAEFPIMTAGFGKENSADVFESEDDFLRWAKTDKTADKILDIHKKVDLAKKLEGTETKYLKKFKKTALDRIQDDMKELSKATKLKPGSIELLLKATVEADLLQGPIFDPVMVFDRLGLAGSGSYSFFPGGAWHDLSWFGWDNRVSSLWVAGMVLLCENTWWGGRNLWLAGYPWYSYGDLRAYSFDNVTSSMWIG